MADPIIVGGIVVVAGVLTYIFWPSNASAADKAAAEKKMMDAACSAGTADGERDGAADAGKVHNPRALLNYSDLKPVQQQFENCYNDGYEKKWVAPSPVVIKDSTPSSGGAGSMSAHDYGCSRGSSSGLAEYESGSGRDPNAWKANLETDGSKKRQAESGDSAAYRQAYKECFIARYTEAAVKAGVDATFSGTRRRKAGVGGVASGGSISWREPYRPAFVRAS